MHNGRHVQIFAALCGFAIAFGWIEATVVVYLREIGARSGPGTGAALQTSLVSLPQRLVALEMMREACTIALLAAVSWLAGRRVADRAGAFLLTFGIWDLTYYAVLRLVIGWPATLGDWDVLFLIPQPWVAPVWAPAAVALLFVAAGAHLLRTSDRRRRYRWIDVSVLTASVLLILGAVLARSGAALDRQPPERFAVEVFWAGVALGAAWFIRVERRVLTARAARPWAGVQVGTLVPEPAGATRVGAAAPLLTPVEPEVTPAPDVREALREYVEATARREALVHQTLELGREITELRERLILMGRSDAVDRPDEFFH
jgi:hypothetical protein